MNTLRILQPGTLATVQDLGRPGHAAMGVATSGAADTLSLRIGNRLVGNEDGAAGIEFSLSGGVVAFEQEAVVALCGISGTAGCVRPRIGGNEMPLWAAVRIGAGEEITLGAYTRGARVYLCVRGGVLEPVVMGSRSAYRAGGIGANGGRGLRAGDCVVVGEESAGPAGTLGDHALASVQMAIGRQVLRVNPGPQAGAFVGSLADGGARAICGVMDASDRVGVRISGLRVRPREGGTMISEGTVHGAIQVPGEDLAIILGPDRPTTGGYPMVATVTAVDLPALGQLRPRDRVRLEVCTLEAARELYKERWSRLDAQIPSVGGSSRP